MIWYKRFLLFIAFFSGAVVMGVELVGSRVLSPYFGSSIFVWGSLISVFMGALSLGYYSGGWYSDRSPSLTKLAVIIIFSAIFLGCVPIFGNTLNEIISSLDMDVRYASLLSATGLFFIPIAALGVVSPYIIRMSTSEVSQIGINSGAVYSVSTLGSILGTILTSFYLIAILGVKMIFWLFSGSLFILALIMILVDNTTNIMQPSDKTG